MHMYAVTQTADQFGEKTYIRRGKSVGGLRRISANAEQVAVLVGSFSGCAHIYLSIEAMYCHEDEGEKPLGGTEWECTTGKNEHTQEGENGGRWTRQTAVILQRSCRMTRSLSMCEVNWHLQHRQWAGRANKSKRPRRCASHRQHSKRDVRRLASWCIQQQNRGESEDYAGDEEGVVIVNGKAIFDIETLSDDCWSSVNNVALRWHISPSTNWVLYLRLSSKSWGVWEKELIQCSSSALGSRSAYYFLRLFRAAAG